MPIPLTATARLQFHAGFTLDDAVPLVPYFARLGISHLYASPILKARPGSTHGYDIVDHDRINPELGGEAALERLVAALRSARAGPHPRHRAEPHGRRRRRQCLVARRARMGPAEPLRQLLRHRLGAARPGAAQPDAGALPRRALWRGAGLRRPDAALRCRDRAVLRAVLRAPLPDRAAALRPCPARRRGSGARGPGAGIRPHRPAAARPRRRPGRRRRWPCQAARTSPPTRPAPPGCTPRSRPSTRWRTPAATGCTGCWNASTTASPGGAPRRTRSTGAASSTSPRSPACGSSCPEVFEATHELILKLYAEGAHRRRAHRPRRRPRRPARLLPQARHRLDRTAPCGRDQRAAGLGREDPGALRVAADRLAGGRHHRLRLHGRGRAASCTTRPARSR